MKSLILVVDQFPYGNLESYLETEIKYLENYFSEIIICSLQNDSITLSRSRNVNFSKLKILIVKKENYFILLYNVLKVLLDKCFYGEIFKICRSKHFSIKKILKLLVFMGRSHNAYSHIHKECKRYVSNSEGIIYSYRFEYQAYVSKLLKKDFPNFRIISRAHRYDLYEELNKVHYIPCRELLLENLDRLVLIAKDGFNYMKNKYPYYISKLMISRLGTSDYGLGVNKYEKNYFKLVSCSTLTQVKRVNIIVEALSLINDINIIWNHYGTGSLEFETKTLASNLLPPNIQYKFNGYINNLDLLEIYKKNPFDAFINVSSSEGVPVSIMEAMSFGIPIIATDAGGTKEIVSHNHNGILLKNDITAIEVADSIRTLAIMSENERNIIRKNARKDWELKSSASSLYPEFIKTLVNL